MRGSLLFTACPFFWVCVCLPRADHKRLVCTCRYESPEVALNCGMMLRECLRHEPLARTVLFSEEFFCFFRYVELSTFDIASDAFASFKVRSAIPLLSLFWEHLFTTLLFPAAPPGPSHQTQSYVCRISRQQLRQGEISVSLSHCC